jgi:hypothetical protein
MTRPIDPHHSSTEHSREQVNELLDAAGSFSRQFDVDVDDLLLGISKMLKRRVVFDRLKDSFGKFPPRPISVTGSREKSS